MPDDAQLIAEALDEAGQGLILVVTGAGVSLASGIPTFRGSDPGAVWKRDLTELATLEYFRRDPAGSWRWYLERFDKVLAARPNPAHFAIAALERWQLARGGRFLLVTQNIDTLHEQAGSRQMVKVHGSADRVRCSRDGCRLGAPAGSLRRDEVDVSAVGDAATADDLPHCPECGALLRQHVLWFDEYYQSHADYQWDRVARSIGEMRVALCIGTSFSVGVTEMVLQGASWNRVPVLSVDPGAPPAVGRAVTAIRAKAEEVLPAACARLGVEVGSPAPG